MYSLGRAPVTVAHAAERGSSSYYEHTVVGEREHIII